MRAQAPRAAAADRAAPGASPEQQAGPEGLYGNSFMQDKLVGTAEGRAWSEGCSETPLDAAGNPVPEQAAPAAPVQITVSNENGDPASSSFDRTTVGVGEKCNFDAMVNGDMSEGGQWSASGGRGRKNRDGFYEWQAPGTPGAYTITYTQGEFTGTIDMTVVAPNDITSTVASTLSPARAGAGMTLDLTIHPLSVSFAHADWYEVPGPGVGTGYFDGRTIPHSAAQGAGNWVNMGSDNKGITDTASMAGWPGPWSQGTHTWTIPTHYRAAGGPSTLFHTSSQVFEITNTAGDSTISKYGSSV